MLIAKDMAATAIVAASATSRGIGYQGQLAWSIPEDMKFFRQVTMNVPSPDKINAVIMGRKTWESIPPKFRPLKGRTNVVLTSKMAEYPPDVMVASSLADAWNQLAGLDNLGTIFVIGGAQVYKQAIEQNYVHKVLQTEVSNLPESAQFDTFFPELATTEWDLVEESPAQETTATQESATSASSPLSYKFQTFERKPNVEEQQYLDLIQKILDQGIERGDRTGTGTKSIFGAQMRFNLRDGNLPLLTTKKVFWRGVAEELLWFISGSTNANELRDKNIHIWDGNASKEFLASRGLGHREEGDLGPVYGFQWRHFGAEYKDVHADYTGQGVDQLAECIHKIIHNPEDRRILLSAWNPTALPEMALPPCHLMCQFYVDTTRNEVSCHMYQRSADMGLGVPFNIASYALLTHLVAHVTGRKAGDLIHTLGDAHVYLNHIEPLREQLKRTPRPFPKLVINKPAQGEEGAPTIDDFVYDDLNVLGYNPHKPISMKMAV